MASFERPVVLAVSGGADSMVMAAEVFESQPSMVAAIATFDHGTGRAARDAVALVAAWAGPRDIPVRTGAAAHALPRREAAWRAARWEFLAAVSAEFGAPVATAHSEDDQVETVFIRLLRHAGVRGLAGLLAPGPVRRPLLHWPRAVVRDRALTLGVPFRDDPSNLDRRHLRNRVRLDLLPALERAEPGFRAWLLSVGTRAATWRLDVARLVDRHWQPRVEDGGLRVSVPRDPRRLPDRDEAALCWPEVAGRIGVALDRRGTARLASFTTHRVTGQGMPLAGGVRVTSRRDEWSMERAGAVPAAVSPSDRRAPRGA
ncbi:MAG: tRNA lysidine(34) synthetase TilS [Gemmatimonadaceae bacterium]|nr:tRNA lysidine(34) synthetase TilS [Gemmatimonadaceae bacterium]